MKGLTTEHGRCATNNSNFPQENALPADAPTPRRQRNSFAHLDPITKSDIKRETDMIMAGAVTTFPHNYLNPQPYHMPSPYEPARKRKNLYTSLDQQETTRGSVLRDGSKTSVGSPSPIGKSASYNRPTSSGSSAAPEADTMQTERDSPQQSKWDENIPLSIKKSF